jgi:DNA repair and recombination protein RAD52
MGFSDQQKSDLSAPLDRSKVAQRTQGGTQVSYIAGWHAIAECNRVFGFDAWNRETVEIKLLGEPREVNGKMRVDYMARVRITVGDIVRDGCGFGQGIDKDVGQAHESALKEAETDAMKRALMTFGNPFGLALYDKSQANVAELPAPVIDDGQWAEVVQLIEATDTNSLVLCDYYKIPSLKSMTVPMYRDAVSRLRKRAEKSA